MILRVEALDHLQAIADGFEEPLPRKLRDVLIFRRHFRAWCQSTGRALPRFWFGEATERLVRKGAVGKANEVRVARHPNRRPPRSGKFVSG